MLLTITTTHEPATDLGYLLHKNPARTNSFSLPFGTAHVFYPEVSGDRCTAALLVDVDPIGLVRGKKGSRGGGLLDQYVNDRPYAASSLLSVTIARVFREALNGKSKERPELVEEPLDLEANIAALPCKGGTDLLVRLFGPLGYEIEAQGEPMDPAFPDWGESKYYRVTLKGRVRLQDLLSHLYVLVPVMDDKKHYWVGQDEVEKLLKKGEGWLVEHPEKDLITRRFLRYRGSLTREALVRLVDESVDPEADEVQREAEEEAVERKLSLNEQRLGTVVASLKSLGARRIVDLGCGEGKLIQAILDNSEFEYVLGMDVSARVLEIAARRLKLERLQQKRRERVDLMQGSLLYRDKRLEGFDAAAVIEVIEHMDDARLAAFERVLFEFAKPGAVVLTTPNVEYNVLFEGMEPEQLRHRDHRFEWTRSEFEGWAGGVAARYGYSIRFLPIGPIDPEAGPPTQMGVFTRAEA